MLGYIYKSREIDKKKNKHLFELFLLAEIVLTAIFRRKVTIRTSVCRALRSREAHAISFAFNTNIVHIEFFFILKISRLDKGKSHYSKHVFPLSEGCDSFILKLHYKDEVHIYKYNTQML